ncbi:uncharacterized protein ACBR49_016723 [Aulostomus maculatus]
MNETGPRRTLPDQSSGSLRTFGTPRHPSITNPIPSKRVCFYKSGDPQFSGLRMVINNRTFKTFDALLDNLSKKVPLPFGVRNITTPRGVHAIYTLDELEDGKSYICSDNRKVKPINLALARKKLPPWYHARPVSSRRRTVQKARAFPGSSIHRQEPVVVHTPKKLVVFRNGDPSVKHTVVLQKRTTPTFESILEYISELMEFPVMKLHTSDGRRVDSLPGLILCSGTVVAAGREPFRPANYAMQKSPAPTRLPTNRMGVRRIKTLNRKKKSLPYTSKSRNFSPSSERYIVNRIHNAIRGNSSDIPSNPTNSFELESSHILESVAETEGDTCLGNGAEGQDVTLPSEDDIEKSFRVNQDGSMTVEMRVRLTIKEEETLHWTTTLTRSSVANQLDMSCLPEPEPDQEICLPKSNPLDLLNPAASTDTINKDKNKDDNDEEPPSLGNGASVESSFGEDDQQTQMDLVSPSRARTPGHKQVRKQQASVESIKSVTADGIQEGVVGSYLYRQQTENGAKTEQYCMVTQSTTRPVPKPRRIGSVDANSISGRNVSSFKSAEIMQIESSGDEVTETVLHIYEQQTCQDNFLANIYRQGGSSSGIPSYRPATSETEQLSSNNEFEPELWRPSTASESISIWRAESKSIPSDITSPSTRTDAIHKTNRQHQIPKSTKGKPQQREVNKDKRISSKPNVINKRFRRLTSPGKRQKESSAETADKHKKTFSSAGFIKRIYGNKSKSQKSTSKLKKRAAQNGQESTKSSQSSEGTTKHSLKELNIPLKVNATVTDSVEAHRMEGSQPRGVLTRQPSMHQEKKKVREIVSLPAFNSSSAVTNEYIENWLEKAHNNPAINADKGKESNNSETTPENESEYNPGLINEGGKCFEKNFEIQTLPENVLQTSVKQRIQSFENKTGPSVETTTVTMPNHTTSTNTGHSFAQNNLEMDIPLTQGETQLPRSPSIKRVPLVSNTSLERKMSLRKACMDSYATAPVPMNTKADNVLPNGICQEESTTHPPQRANQPDMKPVLDRICNAINSIRQITQNKPPSCPEKFNRLPDFSSNVSSTFGSSSKALLAFLSVITLKDGITNLNIEELNANDVSCAEALRMIDSLREIACIEDSGQLRNSLSDLQKSASKQLLESWSDFQEFKSHSSSQKYSEQEVKPGAKLEQDCAIEENIIDEIMEKLGMPETLKEELASLSVGIGKETSTEEEMSSRTIENSSAEVVDRTANEACNVKNVSQEDRANVDVCAIIQTIPDVERQKQSIIPVTAEIANVVRDVVDREKSPESSDTEEQDECQLLQLHSEEPIPENESGSDEPQQDMSNVEEKMSCQESISTSEPTVQQSSEDELECEYEEIKQESRQGDNPESHCEEEEDNCYAELSASRKGNISSPDSKKQSLSEEEQPEIEPQDLLTEKGQECQTGFMGLNVSLNESTCNSDLDEPSLSEDEQLEVEGKELKVEESFSGPDEELNDQQNHREFNTSREENKVSSEDEEIRDKSGVRKENRDSYITKDSNSLIQQLDNSTKHHSFEEEEDSGNDHSNCEEHVDMEQSNVEDDQVRSSTEDELSYFDRESTTETERTKMNKDKSCAAPAMVKLSEDVNCERAVGKLHAEDVISQSVAERVSLLEKQVADAQNRKNITENSNVRCFSQRKADLEADVEELSSEMSQADLHTRSAPQSSLSFSYDSSGVITTEPESNRVRSIREMFLAKSSTDVQHGQRCLPNTTTLSGLRAETSVSGGYQSQTSSELSSGEEDSSRKSISKGFVRRTIERLYGKTDAIPDEDTSERPPSAPKQKKNSSIFSPFHTARAKAMSELSYFNSNNALDTLNEATRCIAFNAQVGPGESVPIDTGGWIIRDNTLIRKSVSDPVGINKNLADSTKDDGMYEDTQENPPYSLFSTNSEPDERKKCTYFSLPHTSDSEVCQDDSKSSTNGDSIVETQWDSSKMGAERNGALAGMSITDFKLIDNKVHPLIELPPDGEVVMVQPGKGQGIMNRRLQEPDVLDLLYNFCGEHCPIL